VRTVLVELAACILLVPVAIVMLSLAALGHGYASTESRVRALLLWYPAVWRERHGEAFAGLLHDTIADGRDGLGLSLDVARGGMAERMRHAGASRLAGLLVAGTGWVMIVPQGMVPALLARIEGTPASWFVALHVGPPARWLVSVGMVLAGAGLLALSRRILARSSAEIRAARG
jgi:hypothetical protein